MRYRSDDPSFRRYEETVTAVVAATGATLWAAPALDATRRAANACSTASSSIPCPRRARAGCSGATPCNGGTVTPDGGALIEHFRARTVGQTTRP